MLIIDVDTNKVKIKKQLMVNKRLKVISNSYTSPTTVQFISKFFTYNFNKIINDQITGVFNLRNSQVVSYYQVAKQIQKYLHKNYVDIHLLQ